MERTATRVASSPRIGGELPAFEDLLSEGSFQARLAAVRAKREKALAQMAEEGEDDFILSTGTKPWDKPSGKTAGNTSTRPKATQEGANGRPDAAILALKFGLRPAPDGGSGAEPGPRPDGALAAEADSKPFLAQHPGTVAEGVRPVQRPDAAVARKRSVEEQDNQAEEYLLRLLRREEFASQPVEKQKLAFVGAGLSRLRQIQIAAGFLVGLLLGISGAFFYVANSLRSTVWQPEAQDASGLARPAALTPDLTNPTLGGVTVTPPVLPEGPALTGGDYATPSIQAPPSRTAPPDILAAGGLARASAPAPQNLPGLAETAAPDPINPVLAGLAVNPPALPDVPLPAADGYATPSEQRPPLRSALPEAIAAEGLADAPARATEAPAIVSASASLAPDPLIRPVAAPPRRPDSVPIALDRTMLSSDGVPNLGLATIPRPLVGRVGAPALEFRDAQLDAQLPSALIASGVPVRTPDVYRWPSTPDAVEVAFAAPLAPPPAPAAGPRFAGSIVHLHAPSSVPEDTLDALASLVDESGFELDQPRRVDFTISSTNVRYFHPEDAKAARALAAETDAAVRDFTNYEPAPPKGTIELWLSGSGPAKATTRSGTRKARSQNSDNAKLIQLRNRILQRLRNGEHL